MDTVVIQLLPPCQTNRSIIILCVNGQRSRLLSYEKLLDCTPDDRRQKTVGKEVNVMSGKHAKICVVTDSGMIDKLARNAEYCCVRCGVKAHDKESVCEPEPLEPDH